MSILDIAKKVIEYGAPLLGFALGGSTGEAIVNEIAHLFGANPNDHNDILSKIQSDPDAKVKLTSIEANRVIELERIYHNADIQKTDDDIKDVEDARKMEEETKSYFPEILSTIIILCFVVSMVFLYLEPIQSVNQYYIGMMLAVLSYVFFMACRFWLGGTVPNFIEPKKGK